MKRLLNKWMLSAFLLTAGVASAGLFVSRQTDFSGADKPGENLVVRAPQIGEKENDKGERVDQRREWFLQQRLYGSTQIPADGRQRAKEEADAVAPELARESPTALWTAVGPQPLESAFPKNYGDASGRINGITVSPADPNIVLLASATGGIWRSTNAMADPLGATPPTFAPVSDNQVDIAVGSIAFAPSNTQIVYAGMGDHDNSYLGTSVLRSTDAGATWTQVTATGLPAQGLSQKIAVKADDPNTVFLARNDANGFPRTYPTLEPVSGFYRSTDGGANWTRAINGQVRDFVQSPNDANVIYATVLDSFQAGAAPAGIYKSTDAGATFNAIGNAPALAGARDFRVAVSPADSASPQRVYYYGGTEAAPQILIQLDNGTTSTWTTINPTKPQLDTGQFAYNTYLAADPSTAGRLYIGSRDIFRVTIDAADTLTSSTNITNVWSYFPPPLDKWDFTPEISKSHSDQQAFSFGATANVLFVGSDGGLQRSDDGGTTFTKNLNKSLSFTQAVGLAIHPTDSTKMYIGSQDNGSIRRVNGLMWKEFSGGDGGQLVLDPSEPSRVFISYILGSLTRFGMDGTEYQAAIHDTFVAPRRSLFYTPLTTNGVDSTLYLGADTLEICTNCATVNGIGNWVSAAGGADLTRGGSDSLSAIAVQRTAYNPPGTQTIYVGSATGAFRVSQNNGATFTDRTGVLDNAVHNGTVPKENPGRYVSSIKIDPANPATAYITVSGFGTRHVFKSTNFGANIAPLGFTVDIPTSDFLIDPLTATTFHIATDIGAFRSTDNGATWNQNNDGMPPVVINQLASAPNGRIAAATFGRGVYTTTSAPTAATVSVSGRVLTSLGRGIANARVAMTDQNGDVRTARTNSFGYYRFSDIEAGQTYIFTVTAKGYRFTPQVTTLNENLEQLNFTAQ